MIPRNSRIDGDIDIEIIKEPSNTYKLNYSEGRIAGDIDGIEAVKQAIYKILFTERYKYVIYSWNYGIELEDLFGRPREFVYLELEDRITEALLQDDRIREVDRFSFSMESSNVTVIFIVHTVYGDLEVSKEVNI